MTNEEIEYVEKLKELNELQKQIIDRQTKTIVSNEVIERGLDAEIRMLKRIIKRLLEGGFREEDQRRNLLELCK